MYKYIVYVIMLSDNNTIIMAPRVPMSHTAILYYNNIQLLYIIIYIVTTRYNHRVYSLPTMVSLHWHVMLYSLLNYIIRLEINYSRMILVVCNRLPKSKTSENDLFEGTNRRFFEKLQDSVCLLRGTLLNNFSHLLTNSCLQQVSTNTAVIYIALLLSRKHKRRYLLLIIRIPI